jgi:hypothetical protein
VQQLLRRRGRATCDALTRCARWMSSVIVDELFDQFGAVDVGGERFAHIEGDRCVVRAVGGGIRETGRGDVGANASLALIDQRRSACG